MSLPPGTMDPGTDRVCQRCGKWRIASLASCQCREAESNNPTPDLDALLAEAERLEASSQHDIVIETATRTYNMNEILRHLAAEVRRLREKANAYDSLDMADREDSARLDWLEEHGLYISLDGRRHNSPIGCTRAALDDAARQAGGPQE